MAFDPANPGAATPADVAAYFASYMQTVRATSQLNADVLAKTRDEVVTALNLASVATGQSAADIALQWLAGISASSQFNSDALADSRIVFTTLAGVVDQARTVAPVSILGQSALVNTTVASPPSVLVTLNGVPQAGVSVAWAVASGGGSVDTTGALTTDANGVATLTSWTLGAAAGPNSVTATVTGAVGSPATFSANGTAVLPTQLVVQSGGTQTGIVAGQNAVQIVFRVKDVVDAATPGVLVGFSTNLGTLSAASDTSDGSGDVQVTLTTDVAVGTATVTASFTNAAGQTVTASTTIASTYGAATALRWITQPSSNGLSGTALSQQPVLEVVDANGNRVGNSGVTVTATVTTGNATISAGGSVAAVSGLVTFTLLKLVDTDSGTNVLTFASGALTAAVSNTVTLAPPIPHHLGIVVQPSTMVAGGFMTPAVVVSVLDVDGAVVPGATDAVTVALGDNGEGAVASRSGAGGLSPNAVAGLATFDLLSVNIAAGLTLVFSSGTLTGVTSIPFTVNAAGGGVSLDPGGMTEIFNWSPTGSEPPDTFISGGGANTALYGLSKGKMRASASSAGNVTGGEFVLRFPTGQTAGVSPGNQLYIKDDQPGNTDGNSVDSWDEYWETIKFRCYGPPANPNRFEILASGGTGKLLGQYGFAVSGNIVPNQLIGQFRSLPRSQSPWGPGVFTQSPGGFSLVFIQQGAAAQTGAPNGNGGTAATYNPNVAGWNSDKVQFFVDPARVYTVQTYMKMNTIGQDNGILKSATDTVTPGVLVQTHNYTNCRFRDASNPRGFFGRHLAAVLGGGGPGAKVENSFMAYDDWQIKVKTVID